MKLILGNEGTTHFEPCTVVTHVDFYYCKLFHLVDCLLYHTYGVLSSTEHRGAGGTLFAKTALSSDEEQHLEPTGTKECEYFFASDARYFY